MRVNFDRSLRPSDLFRGPAIVSNRCLKSALSAGPPTVAGHLDRKGVPCRSEATVWDDCALRETAEL